MIHMVQATEHRQDPHAPRMLWLRPRRRPRRGDPLRDALMRALLIDVGHIGAEGTPKAALAYRG